MDHKQSRLASIVVFVAAMSASAMAARAEPITDEKAQIIALERRIAALEQMKEAPTVAPVTTSLRHGSSKEAKTSAADVRRYLQYPGQ